MEGYCKFFHALRDEEKLPSYTKDKTEPNGDGNHIFFRNATPSLTETFFRYFQVGKRKSFNAVLFRRAPPDVKRGRHFSQYRLGFGTFCPKLF